MLRCNMQEAKDNDKWQKKIVIKVTTIIKQFKGRFYFLKPTANITKRFSIQFCKT